jgi:hypothetical protein
MKKQKETTPCKENKVKQKKKLFKATGNYEERKEIVARNEK